MSSGCGPKLTANPILQKPLSMKYTEKNAHNCQLISPHNSQF